MAQFEGNLSVNGYDLGSRYRLEGFQIKGSEDNMFGINRSAIYTEGFFEGNKDENIPQITIELAKVDKWYNPIAFNDNELDEILRVLYMKDISCITHNGYNYYGVFTMGSKTTFGNSNKGYLTLNFQSASPYCYTPLLVNTIKVSGEKIIEVYNNSNVKNFLMIDMEIEKVGSGNIEVTNLTVKNNSMKINGLVDGEIVKVYGEECGEIYTNIEDKNIVNLTEGEFVKLRYGKNLISIKGNCRLNIITQEPRIIK